MENKLIKYFLVFFILSFLILNWERVSFIFNRQIIFQSINDLKDKFFERKIVQGKEIKFEYSEKENRIEIPSINITAPILVVREEKEIESALEKGVVLFPGSALPGEKGITIIHGHSSPPNWPKIKYDWVFNNLNNLSEGNEIILIFNHRKLHYFVIKKIIISKNKDIFANNQELTNLSNYDNILLLISCWPPGYNKQRIIIISVLKK